MSILQKEYFILSDLHLEFRQGKEREFWETFPETKAKVCICAGDLTSLGLPESVAFSHFTELCKRFDKVIYVPGNHEYYGSDPTSVEYRIRSFESLLRPTLTVLRSGEPYVYEGQRFIGDTMWFVDKPQAHIYKNIIADYKQIRGLYPWAFTRSNLFNVFLRENLKSDDIVITHHIPIDFDTSPMWKDSPTQAFFLNDTADNYLTRYPTIVPKAWIYGHTHDYHNFEYGGTTFICNPAGYPSEANHWKERVTYQI